MTKFLRDILDAHEPLFTQSLREMEYITGKKKYRYQIDGGDYRENFRYASESRA